MRTGKNIYIFFIIAFMLLSGNVYSQKDSIWVTLTYNYGVENGKRTGEKIVINQKTYTLGWQLLRELKLDPGTGQINSYTVYFYDKQNRPASIEEYSMKDSLICARKFGYDLQNRVKEILYYKSSSPVMPVLEKREVIAYLSDTIKKSIVAYGPEKKKKYTVKFKYDRDNKTDYIETVFRVHESGIAKISEKRILNNAYYITELHKTISYRNGNTVSKKTEYVYSDQMQPVILTILNEGVVERVINYKYFANNQLQVIEETDANGELVSYKTFDYQIHYINLGNNKSSLK